MPGAPERMSYCPACATISRSQIETGLLSSVRISRSNVMEKEPVAAEPATAAKRLVLPGPQLCTQPL